MKKLFVLILVLGSLNCFAQSGWITQNSNTPNSLWGLYFSNSLTGYSVGSNNTLTKTTNGGNNWTIVSLGVSFSGYSITFIDNFTGYISCGGRNSFENNKQRE
jgi:photosystem II stability/assembly factor-like uncharacterized protein